MNPVQQALPADLARESKFQNFTRLGFIARGVLYITIALLVLRTGRTEDLSGALEYLRTGVGAWLLGIMAAGMIGYGLWRLADAALGIENPEQENAAYAKRAAAGLVAAVYLYLAYKAVRVLLSAGAQMDSRQQSDTLLDLPGREVILLLAAAGMLVAAGSQFITAFKCNFLKRLGHRAREPWVKWLGRLGYAARGIVFLTVSYLIARAALAQSRSDIAGTEQALSFLSGPLQFPVAAGLALFGIFSLVEARYRQIHEPDMDGMKRQVSEKLR